MCILCGRRQEDRTSATMTALLHDGSHDSASSSPGAHGAAGGHGHHRSVAELVGERVGEHLSARRESVRRVLASSLSDKRAQTQTLLLAAGRELFTDKGIGATSVGDVCSRAGFTRGAFYSNFTDMDHFVRRLAEQEWTAMAAFVRSAIDEVLPDAVQEPPASDAQVQASLAALASRILRVTPVSREFFLLQNELVAYIVREGERSAPVREAYAQFKAAMREVLVLGMEAIGRECLLSPDDTTELIFAAAERSMRVALLAGTDAARPAEAVAGEGGPAGGGADGVPVPGSGEAGSGVAGGGGGEAGAGELPPSTGEPSAQEAAASDRRPLLTDQLDRILPVLLTHLSRPLAA